MEGQTATNPQTGEKIVFRGGQWQPVGGSAPRPQSGPVYGPGPKAPAQPTALQTAADTRDERRLTILEGQEADRRSKELEDAAAKAEEETRSKAALLSRLKNDAKNIVRLGRDANDNAGWGETGTSGAFSRAVLPSGTAGYDLSADIETFKAKNAFAGLSALADQGIKLTPVSNEEIKLAAASIANLDPNAGHDTFMRAVDQTKQYYYDAIARLDPLEAYQVALENGESAEAIADIARRNNGPVPDPAILQQAVDFTASGGTGASFRPPEDTPPSGPNGGGGLGDALYAGVGDVAEGVGDVLGLVGNPLNAGINAIAGTNLSTDLGQTFRDATGAPEGNPVASAINRGGVAALTSAGGAALARPIVSGVGTAVTNALAQQPIRQGVAGMSAGGSAEIANQMGAPVPVQVAAGLAGGMAGYGATGLPNALMAPRVQNPTMQAATRQGIEMLPADVGGPTIGRLSAAAAQGPISAQPVVNAAQRANTQFGQATQRASQGSRLAADDAGDVVRQAGERFTKESRAKGNALYTRAERMAQGVRIKPKGAIQTIDEQITQLRDGGEVNEPLIGELTKFRNSLAQNSGIKIGGMRDIRTGAQNAAYSDGLRTTPAKRVFGIVADAISQDIDAGLAQAGRQNAAQAFKTADSYWRERVQYIDNVLEPIIGSNKSGESVLQAVEGMSQGKGKGVQTLAKLMRSLDREEASDIQATIIDRMGRASAGQQNADGDIYSASTFLTNWNKMSGKGKAAIFPNPEARKNLDELAKVAESMKEASRYSNYSNTAGGIAGQVVLTGGLGAVSPTALILGSGAQYLSGRLLASPSFARWLASMPKNPQAQQAHIKRLGAIASSQPIIANDIASVQQFLASAPGLSRAAASEGNNVSEERPIQPQR